jgi:7,8-dihydropterin-6-yl-methyl-4-(beta-D-ribofuranosyl)aminobenzene 5'-phosphate synthase
MNNIYAALEIGTTRTILAIGEAETGGRLESAAGELCGYPTRYFTCHCTGEEQYRFMKEFMGEKLQYLSSGDVIEL